MFLASLTPILAEIWHPQTFGQLVGATALFGVLGIVLVLVALKVYDALMPQVNFGEELKKGNVAVAIVIAGMAVAVALVVAAAVGA